MKYKISEIKGLSRENLLGNYSLPIGVFLITEIVIALISSPFQRMLQNGTDQLNPSQILIGIVGEIIVLMIAILFGAGLAKVHLNIARRKPATMQDFIYPFKNHPDKFMGFGILLILISAACSLPGSICLGISAVTMNIPVLTAGIILLCIGIIFALVLSLGFSLTTYMLLDDPYDTKVIPAMKKSWHYMKGRKKNLFLLYLSFIGLLLLGILSFGIGLLWIEQYYLQSQIVFYLKTTADHMEYHEILGNSAQ